MSVIIGSGPFLFAYYIGGIDLLDKTAASIFPSGLLSSYAVILTFLGLGSMWFFPSSKVTSDEQSTVHLIAAELRPAALTLFRIVAGALLTFTALWAIEDYKSFDLYQASRFISLGGICFLFSVGYHYLVDYISSHAAPLPRAQAKRQRQATRPARRRTSLNGRRRSLSLNYKGFPIFEKNNSLVEQTLVPDR